MRVVHSVMPASFVLALAVLVAACGGDSQPADRGTDADSQRPPSAEIVKHMHDHLAQVDQVQQAVVRGDLEEAKTAAGRFAEHEELRGMPDSVKPAIDDMQEAAQEVSKAGDLQAAGDGTAKMVMACGSCHRSMSATPGFPTPEAQAKPKNKTAAQMLEHQRAVDMLYQALIVPSDDLWAKGAEALKASPLKADPLPAGTKASREVLDAQSQAHEVAEKAADAKAPSERADLYGDLIGRCASCHMLSGRVLGPGLPK